MTIPMPGLISPDVRVRARLGEPYFLSCNAPLFLWLRAKGRSTIAAEDTLIAAATKGSIFMTPSLRVTAATAHTAPAIRANTMPFPLILFGVEFVSGVIRVDVIR